MVNYTSDNTNVPRNLLYYPNTPYPTIFEALTDAPLFQPRVNGDLWYVVDRDTGNPIDGFLVYYKTTGNTIYLLLVSTTQQPRAYWGVAPQSTSIYGAFGSGWVSKTFSDGTKVYVDIAILSDSYVVDESILNTINSNSVENTDIAYLLLKGAEKPQDSDPFAPGGTSEPGGGNGTFNGTSDSNPIPGDPAISATDTGFMTVFATNTAGLRALANSLWTDIFSAIQPGGTLEETVKALKNMVGSPYDAILGCHIVPVNVPTGSSRSVKMYGVLPSQVSLPVASSQWVHKDCGSLTIAPYDGSYLDYAPYSKVTSLYLPFVGVVSVDIDIIMNTTIGVYYKIDIVSGQCIVYVTKNNDVYFQYQGQCAVPIPVTSIDWSNTVNAGLGLIGSVTNIVGSAVGGGVMGGPAGALAGAVTGTIGQAGSMAQNVMNSKPDIKAGSGVGGAAALLGCKSPYLIIERPRKSTPQNQNHYTGYPSNIRAKLGDLSGYTEVSRVYVNHMSATQEEKEEIENLLNGGVIL